MRALLEKPISKKSESRESFLKSYALWALLGFLVIELGLRLTGSTAATLADSALKFSALKVSHRSWVYWDVRELLTEEKRPQIGLLGSSLMMTALHGGDAVYLNAPQNVCFHHKSTLLKDLIEEKLHQPGDNFAFALGGEMVSDAYELSRSLFKDKHQPQCIIYGIAPRDFMDHALPSVTSTEIYKYVDRYNDEMASNLKTFNLAAYASPADKLEYLLKNLSFIYNHREDFLYLQHRYAAEICQNFLGYQDMEMVKTPLHIRRQAFSELPEDSGPNEVQICPPSVPQEPYVANLSEYQFRYRKVSRKQFNEQISYLAKLLDICRNRKIAVILVNMPLTRDNMGIMPEGFYRNYLDRVEAVATAGGADWLDLNKPSDFPQRFFSDSVHLNTRGGRRFFDVLTEKLAQNEKYRNLLKL